MRVLIVNTSEMSGGAAIAASRLTDALNHHGVKAHMLVRDKQSDRVTTIRLPWRLHMKMSFLWERFCIWIANGFRREGLWHVDIANAGADISSLPEFREADIIHLHWVNQGLLSLRQLSKILQSGKPVVWTMHDMWPCTAICHHARDCEHYHSHCHHCPQLLRPGAKDLSWEIYERKRQAYGQGRITFVACSQWLAAEARKSGLLRGLDVVTIPNTYSQKVFHPSAKGEARRRCTLPTEGRLLLFACQKVTNARKGFDYLMAALRSAALQPWHGQLTLVVVGQLAEQVMADLPFPVHAIGYLSDEADMAALYQAVDLFVTPALEENLPNTIMESMACGTPCVGFNIGGIPEMIDHEQNGYVANYRDAEDLARGIDYVLRPENHSRLSEAAAKKATASWNEEAVTHSYIQLYEQINN